MFRATQERLINWIGKTSPQDIINPNFRAGVINFSEEFEKNNKEHGVSNAEIRGSTPHKSSDDPSDPNDVISVRFTNDKGRRIATAHVYEDGTGKVIRW